MGMSRSTVEYDITGPMGGGVHSLGTYAKHAYSSYSEAISAGYNKGGRTLCVLYASSTGAALHQQITHQVGLIFLHQRYLGPE